MSPSPLPGPLPQAAPGAIPGAVDWDAVRADFPLLQREVHGKPLVYFDSANTGQKPASVIAAVDDFYRRHNANVSRAVHQLGSEATEAYEGARKKLARFVNVRPDELVLCSGTTFAINLVAYSWALPRLQPGDAILLTRMEHHANIVPWQLVAERTGASIKVAELTPDGALDLDALPALMTPEVKLFAFAHVSNVLGTVNPVRELCRRARRRGIVTVVDGSQALPHRPVDIAALGCDFYAFTGHKMCGPTGTGALWARREHLAAMPPFIGGGEMIREVRFDGTVYNDPPYRFEAGTPNIAGFVGLGAAVDYLDALGMDGVEARERALLAHLHEELAAIDGLRVFGTAPGKSAIVSFVLEGAHAHDLATLLDLEGFAIRSGQHCAHPLLAWFGVAATCRASLAFYNTHDEVERFAAALRKVRSYPRQGCRRAEPAPPCAATTMTRALCMLPELRFRDAIADDVPAIVALVTSAYRGDASRAGWTTEADLLDGNRIDPAVLRHDIERPRSRVLLAERDGEMLACAHLAEEDGAGYFGMFSVRPALQGGGVGKRMLAEAERIVREDWRLPVMRMTVIDIRDELIAFYERRGYRRTGIHKPFPHGDARFGIPKRDDLRFEVLEKPL